MTEVEIAKKLLLGEICTKCLFTNYYYKDDCGDNNPVCAKQIANKLGMDLLSKTQVK